MRDDNSVLVEDHDGLVLVLPLNRPGAHKPLSPELIGSLTDSLRAGDRASCAGMDRRAFSDVNRVVPAGPRRGAP